MAFQTKDFASVAASMLNWLRASQQRVTDFNVGSVARTLLEAPAIEIDELYQQMFSGLKEAIPVSVFNSFDFSALPSIPAGGLITVTIQSSSTPVIITAGSVFTPASGGVTYTALQNITIAPSVTTASVPVVAVTPGVVGNIAAASPEGMARGQGGFTIDLINAATNQVVATAPTASNGAFVFNGVGPLAGGGTYLIREESQTGFVQTTTDPAAFAPTSGTDVSTFLFGTFRLFSVGGTAYVDLNGNGVQDSGEAGAAGEQAGAAGAEGPVVAHGGDRGYPLAVSTCAPGGGRSGPA